jgi:hypothetical protein
MLTHQTVKELWVRWIVLIIWVPRIILIIEDSWTRGSSGSPALPAQPRQNSLYEACYESRGSFLISISGEPGASLYALE